jgi:hypothetical protein
MQGRAFLFLVGVAMWGTACERQLPAAASAVPGASPAAAEAAVNGAGSVSNVQTATHPSETIVDVTAGTTATSNNYVGQSVTIPGHGEFKQVFFNWYTTGGSPTAFGSLYLLDQEFLGAPADLGPSTPGFIAESMPASGGQYAFDPKVKIKGGEKYWFYTDAQGAFATGFASDTYAGGDMYITGLTTFHLEPTTPGGGYVDANFRLQAR